MPRLAGYIVGRWRSGIAGAAGGFGAGLDAWAIFLFE
jgi:hypothetical protein